MTFKNFGKNWWFFKILAKIVDFSKFWVQFEISSFFSKILKNHHFFSQNWEKSSFYAKILKNHHFFPKFWKKHHFFPKNWKNYYFYQSLIVSYKYPILVSNILVSDSIQYWYQILACLVTTFKKWSEPRSTDSPGHQHCAISICVVLVAKGIRATRFTSFSHFKSTNFESANTLSKCESKATLPICLKFIWNIFEGSAPKLCNHS